MVKGCVCRCGDSVQCLGGPALGREQNDITSAVLAASTSGLVDTFSEGRFMARLGAFSAQGPALAVWAPPPGAAPWPHVSPEGQPRTPAVGVCVSLQLVRQSPSGQMLGGRGGRGPRGGDPGSPVSSWAAPWHWKLARSSSLSKVPAPQCWDLSCPVDCAVGDTGTHSGGQRWDLWVP